MRCANCGTENAEGSGFCTSCQQPLAASAGQTGASAPFPGMQYPPPPPAATPKRAGFFSFSKKQKQAPQSPVAPPPQAPLPFSSPVALQPQSKETTQWDGVVKRQPLSAQGSVQTVALPKQAPVQPATVQAPTEAYAPPAPSNYPPTASNYPPQQVAAPPVVESPPVAAWSYPISPPQQGAAPPPVAESPPAAAWNYPISPPPPPPVPQTGQKAASKSKLVPVLVGAIGVLLVAILLVVFIPRGRGSAAVSAPPVQAPPQAGAAPSLSQAQDTPWQKANAAASAPTGGVYAITVGQCPFDAAQVFVDGTVAAATVSSGVVYLENVSLNSTIHYQITVDDIQYDADASFTDPQTTTLSFGPYTTQVSPSAEYRDAPLAFANREQAAEPFYGYLEVYYSSLLTSVSEKNNVEDVLRVTERQRSELAQYVPFDLQRYTYNYQGSGFNPGAESLRYTTDNGRPALEFLAFFQHQYTPLGGGETMSAQVYYTVQMIYVAGEWKVNRWAQISEEDYNNANRVEFDKVL